MAEWMRFRSWLTIIGLFTGIALIVSFMEPGTNASGSRFFVCSNSSSPVVDMRPDHIEKCCDGSVEERELTRRNLMIALRDVTVALRALPRGKADLLDGPETLKSKADCYLGSIQYLSKAIKGFPPEKNSDQVAKYNEYLDDLNTSAALVVKHCKLQSQSNAVKSFELMKSTCGACHFTFRE